MSAIFPTLPTITHYLNVSNQIQSYTYEIGAKFDWSGDKLEKMLECSVRKSHPAGDGERYQSWTGWNPFQRLFTSVWWFLENEKDKEWVSRCRGPLSRSSAFEAERDCVLDKQFNDSFYVSTPELQTSWYCYLFLRLITFWIIHQWLCHNNGRF